MAQAAPPVRLEERKTLSPRESWRQRREASNKNSPLLKLPAELRNEIYELAIPRNKIFETASNCANQIKYVQYHGIHTTIPIRKSREYRRQFGITQVCRQLRQETTAMAYKNNIFMLQVWARPGGKRNWQEKGSAEDWMKSRPIEALKGLSRVILQHWIPEDAFTGMEMVLFEPSLKVAERVRHAILYDCASWHDSGPDGWHDCSICYEKYREDRNYEGVMSAVASVRTVERPGGRLLELIREFRDALPDEPEWI